MAYVYLLLTEDEMFYFIGQIWSFLDSLRVNPFVHMKSVQYVFFA